MTPYELATADSVISALIRMRNYKLRIIQDENGSFFIVGKGFPDDPDKRHIHDLNKAKQPKSLTKDEINSLKELTILTSKG